MKHIKNEKYESLIKDIRSDLMCEVWEMAKEQQWDNCGVIRGNNNKVTLVRERKKVLGLG